MNTAQLNGRWRALAASLMICSAHFFVGCNNTVIDPTNSTTQPGSGTVTTPATGTATTPGTGTTTTPGTGTTTTPGTGSGTTGTVLPTVSFVNAHANLNFLEAAIARAGLADEINKGGLTLFAPTDDAFKAAGFADVAAVSAASATDLRRILQYHIVSSVVDLSAFPTAVNTSYQTNLTDARLTVYKTSDANVSVNTAKIVTGNNATVNSVVHIINQVLTPPTRTAVDQINSNTDLSFLVAAIERAGSSIQSTLTQNSTTGLTIFAPNNAAFKAAGYADVAAIRAADPQKLADILKYHVLNYRAFSQNFQNGADVVTAQGASLRFNISNGKVTITGKGNGANAANIMAADIVTSNSVIHIIDRLLLPTNP